MPFTGERASYAPLRRIMQSEKVVNLQRRFKRAPARNETAPDDNSENYDADSSARELPDILLAIDGGYHSAEVDTGFPGAEIGYITVASVLILLKELRKVAADDIINPVKFRETQKKSSIDTALPGRGVLLDEERSPKDSMRKTLFEEMQNCRLFESGESLLETYESLLNQARPAETKCPCGDAEYKRNAGKYACEKCQQPLYSTDALRLHELFSNNDSCEKMYGHVMTTLERLRLLQILRAFESRGDAWLSAIGKMAFILDGPLAVYGTPAWISAPIFKELGRLNELQKERTGRDMMIISIEKSGAFCRHFEMIDSHADGGAPGKFPKKRALLLDDRYIRAYIVPTVGERQYGGNTYFGRKCFYKTALGHRLVVNFASYTEQQKNLESAAPERFPRLHDALFLLDKISSNMYKDSVSALIAAHSEASIPINLGKKILDDFAKEIIGRGERT